MDPVHRMDFLFCKGSLIVLLAVGMGALPTTAQQQWPKTFSHPPTSFSAEDGKFPDAVPLPDCVRRALASDGHVLNALEDEHLSPEQLPADWFTASAQELAQGKGTYFVVMGEGQMRGANINPFWIIWQHPKSCDLLLAIGAHDIDILKTKTNGLPDIRVLSATANRWFEDLFSFDGHNYQELKTNSQPIGEEIPSNLSGFETRKPLVQGNEEDPEAILGEARAWLWQRWWLEKPSYLSVTLHSSEGDRTTTTYFITKVGGHVQLKIQKHKIFGDRTGAQHPMVEDQLVVADDVERRLIVNDKPEGKTIVPEGQEAPPDSYELYFNDDAGENVAIL